ncbi:neuronal calcium sensor 1-like [Branchiostoma floridae x Branchiostoma japonicum]
MGKVLSLLPCGGVKKRSTTRGQSRRMIAQLARKTNFNEKEVRQWQSLFLKDCPDGSLSRDKFVAFYCAFFESVNDQEKVSLARQIFRTFDQDGDGQVDFPEFLRGMSALLRGTTAQRLRWAFSMYDIDNNGELSRDELLNVLKLMYELQHPRRRTSEPGSSENTGPGSTTHLEKLVDRLLSVLDDNNDGHVQMKEFVEGVRRNPQLLTFDEGD